MTHSMLQSQTSLVCNLRPAFHAPQNAPLCPPAPNRVCTSPHGVQLHTMTSHNSTLLRECSFPNQAQQGPPRVTCANCSCAVLFQPLQLKHYSQDQIQYHDPRRRHSYLFKKHRQGGVAALCYSQAQGENMLNSQLSI